MPTQPQSDQGFAYQPVQLPDAVKPPMESPFGGQPGPNMQGAGNITHGGAIAGVFDNLLRGAVNGYAQGQQHKALTLKKTQDDLTTSYNMDAQRRTSTRRRRSKLMGSWTPNDPEFQKLKSAVDGSWGALQQFRGTLLESQMGKKKGGKKGGEQQSPMQVMMDPKATPQEKAAAALAISSKLGAPVYGRFSHWRCGRRVHRRSSSGRRRILADRRR